MSIEVGRVGMVPIESIIIEDRAREDMGNLEELEANMRESGLISPLAVKELDNNQYRLLAGERRLTVLKRNNISEVPVRIFNRDLSDLEMKVIEKAENFYRKDMEYWEMDKLTLEIHRMQQSIHGIKSPGPGSVGWSTGDTGEMLGGITKAAVSQSIKRAELREAMPEVFDGCKTASDAMTVIKKLDEALVKQTIAKSLESRGDDKLLGQLSKHFIIKDFFEGVKEIPAGIMHLVEVDPPYAIDLAKMKKKDGESQYILENYNEVDVEEYQLFMAKVFHECYRVMAEHSWLICWFAPEPWFEVIYHEICNAGFTTTRMCGIWSKPSGQTMNPDRRLANSYEMFFYAWKGSPVIARQRSGNVFNYSPVPAQKKSHPTERPLELTDDLYETFAFPGSRILIPFLGSGNGLISAHKLGMSAVGFELTKAYKDAFLVKIHGM